MNTHQAEFVIQTSTDHHIYFTLRASNHEVVLTSETYTSIGAAHKGIEAVRTAASSLDNFLCRDATNGQPYFVLLAANHELIGTSELYSSNKERDKGIVACQRAARDEQVVDRRGDGRGRAVG
jgi:uncharacterized protein